jgi:general secretion pathway protein G
MTDHPSQSVPSPGRRIFARASAGFTLIEMLVVLTIIGLVGPKVLGYLAESRVKTAKLQIESFNSALDLFYMDVGRYPTDSEGLKVLVDRPPTAQIWNGPYVRGGRVPQDPWGHPYQYHTLAGHTPPYEITSLGPDGHGGRDAISADATNAAH